MEKIKHLEQSHNGICGRIQGWKINIKTGKITQIHTDEDKNKQKNLTPNSYLNALVAANTGTSTDFEVKFVAFSATYDRPQRTDGLAGEIYRQAYTTRAAGGSGNLLIVTSQFSALSFTTPKTTINGAAITDASIFELTDSTGFEIGYRFLGPDNEEREIVDKTGDEIELNKPLINTPVGGEEVHIPLSRLHLVYGASATSTKNTGAALSIAKFVTTKSSNEMILTRHEISYIGS